MEINVAQLLKATIGTTRHFEVNEIMAFADDGNSHHVQGEVSLVRTHRGILLKSALYTEAELACSRCLSPLTCLLTLDIEEEYMPEIDVITGIPLPPPEEPGTFTINEHHILDLTEAVRQHALLAIPMKPLCREDCAGLCLSCGHNLNDGHCDCPTEAIDPRWSNLINQL